ncbi:YbaB/EbfC family nucleoid-associated protein [Patescibacteria group bacterium]|nr:YbaB/EbfC family nucleoid-associated protein [Patescibacteria group bacterium]HOM78140.1 YbaB/EbfC family nucleoid-associated protein [bacterium]
MLDKVKRMNELRKAQSKLQKQLEEISIVDSSGDYEVRIRGDKRIEEIKINGESNKDLKDLINSTMKQVDKKVQKKMQGQLSDLGLDL